MAKNMKVGPNEQCPCGSGLKYKKCYKAGNDCKLFEEDSQKRKLETHREKEKEIVDFLIQAVEEAKHTFQKNEKGDDILPARVQLLVCFSMIDIFASYWHCYLKEKTDKQSERATQWLEQFCFSKENNYNNLNLKNIDVNLILSLRNSIVHFFALPKPEENQPGIVLIQNNFPDDQIEVHEKKFKNKGAKVLYLKPAWIKDWLIKGAELMFEEMMKNVELSKTDNKKAWEHINGIGRIYEKIQVEGAKRIDLEKYN